MGGRNLCPIIVMLLLFLLTVLTGLGIESMYSYSSNVVVGDFDIVWSSENVLYYDEFYVVAPNTVLKDMGLIYGKNIVCRSLSIAISSLGIYTFHTIINGTRHYVYVDEDTVKVQLANVSTGGSIVDQFTVPKLYALYISVVPSTAWIRDPITGGMVRAQRLVLYVEGYGIENVRKSYNISGTLPSINRVTVGSIVYNATRAVNHYITIYVEYPQKPRNVLIVFAPRAEERQQVVTTATETVTVIETATPSPVVSAITSTLVLEKTVTRGVTYTSAITTTIPAYITVVGMIPTTTTIERTVETTIEKGVMTITLVQTIEKGCSIYTLVGVAVVSIIISVSLALLLVSRRPP